MTTTTLTLTDFLLARIAEDEAAARGRALDQPIHFIGCYYYDNSLSANESCDCDEEGHASGRQVADLKAKRRIVELCTRKSKERPPPHGTLRLLASVYADHPDFRDEWRP